MRTKEENMEIRETIKKVRVAISNFLLVAVMRLIGAKSYTVVYHGDEDENIGGSTRS